MRAHPVVLLALGARVLAAQSAPSATVSGVVHDSLTGFPLSGAVVQLASADGSAQFASSATSDSLGRYAIPNVPAGRYLVGFLHPLLDSIGVDAPVREVRVDGSRGVRADLATPSARRLRLTICNDENAGLFVGYVRSARDRSPAGGVSVVGEWLEITLRKKEFIRNVPRLVAITADNGWFAMCNVPVNGSMKVSAARGGDSTDVIEILVPESGFLRRELYLGPERTGRLSGTVRAMAGPPLPGASIHVGGGPSTRANDRGEWTITDVPVGTRVLEIRAVGFYPERSIIDVIPGETGETLHTSLSTLQSVLDTVHVTASRLGSLDRAEFMTRKRITAGTFLTGEDVARRGGLNTTDVFKTIPGVRIGFASDTAVHAMDVDADPYRSPDHRILMRGIDADWCAPLIFINGLSLRDVSSEEVDVIVRVKAITGIEVYSETATPAQFQMGPRGCGTILIWTKER